MKRIVTFLALSLALAAGMRAQHEVPEFVEMTNTPAVAASEPAAMAPEVLAPESVLEPAVEETLPAPAPTVPAGGSAANESTVAPSQADSVNAQPEMLPSPAEVLPAVAAAEPSPAPAEVEAPAPAVPEAGSTAGRVDLSAYVEVLKENQELKKRIEESSQNEEAVRRENEKLALDVKEMERKTKDLAGVIESLRSEKAAAPTQEVERVASLEAKLTAAEAEKSQLGEQMALLRDRLAAREAASAAPVTPPTAPTVAPDSDLFKKVEQENILLKQKLGALDAERKKAEEAREAAAQAELKQKELERDLVQARAAREQERKNVQKLAERIPEIEKELSNAQSTATGSDSALAARERDLETMRLELDRRENRLIKAERMAALLEKTRSEIRQASDKEKRDMHYNMASVYAREGRFKDAEREYLDALRIDPSDADSHYNLAILYDDELQDTRRAAMHYRRYLKLRPNAPDADTVKNWLIELNMRQ